MNLNQDLQRIIDYLDEKIDLHNLENYSLYNGIPGLMIYYYYLGTYLDNKSYIAQADKLFDNIREKLESGEIGFRIFHSLSYGLTGIAYAYWHLNKYGFRESNYEDFEGIEEILLPCCEEDFKRFITDNLHGPMGVFYYFSKVQHHAPQLNGFFDKMVEMYDGIAIKDEWGMRIKNNSVKEVDEHEFNMSLSHGLCGNLLIFAEAYANGYRSEKMLALINRGLEYITNTENLTLYHNETNSHFPSFFLQHDTFDKELNRHNYTTRLAWCYGDLNMALLYIRLGKLLDKKCLYEKGIVIAERTLWRKTRMEAQVTDVFFCHGAGGLAHLYFRLYHMTGKKEFLQQSDHWMKITSDRLGSSLENEHQENPLSLLEGYPGVALLYLSRITDKPLPWDDIFLLNF